jgi:hypothetical protein
MGLLARGSMEREGSNLSGLNSLFWTVALVLQADGIKSQCC